MDVSYGHTLLETVSVDDEVLESGKTRRKKLHYSKDVKFYLNQD